MAGSYDVIVVGARCAGASTAQLLARRGHRVLMVDRATFPSDTVSTHFVHPPGVAALERLGVREQLAASGCPPIRRYCFDFGPFGIAGSPRALDGVDVAYCPRRTVLDALLVEAAAAAGVEVREGFAVEELLFDDGVVTGIRGADNGGAPVTEQARVVVGADGRNSFVARSVHPEHYGEKPAVSPALYSYWSGVESAGFDVFVGERCGGAAFPTHDGLTLVIAGMPEDDFDAGRHDAEDLFVRTLERAPALAERVRAGTREERFRTATGLAGWFRKPYGPGWALVGDAGYRLHPITAQGMTDAFLDAERLVAALDDHLAGRAGYDDAMSAYQAARDAAVAPMYEMTFELAQLDRPPPPEMQQLLFAVSQQQDAMDDFVSVQAGTLPVPSFFDPANVERIVAAGG
jgi:2-polyprenyl-6-methoxyphenol hydroxylase-like FAD-dependent oxidoreductase